VAVSVSVVLVRAFVEVVEREGVPRDRLLAGTGVHPSQLEATDARIEFTAFADVGTRALDLTRDEALGLHIAERASEAAFDLVAHLVVHAPTLRDGIDLALQFQRVFADDSELSLVETGDVAAIRLSFPRTTLRADRLHAEFVMAGVLRLIRTFAPRTTVRAVRFEHARPEHHAECTRVFAGADRYRQPITGLEVDRAVLARPGLHHHPELYELLRGQAQRTLARVTRGIGQAERVRQYFLSHPPRGASADMGVVARSLGMSVRSLRRRLGEEGVSYKTLVEEALVVVATRMLGDAHRSIQETAYAMGFSDATAFHRAFKRWTTMTPSQYRESVLHDAASR
jgi:AraC-like DNA-binding protein